MKRAILSGATGVVGIALMQELIAHQVEILVLCHEGSKRNSLIPDNPLIKKIVCSLSDLHALQNETGKQYDIFYHFAWEGTTGAERNDFYLQNLNVRYALDAVLVAKRFGCQTFIGAGSQAEYGRCNEKLKPDTPTFPETGYGIAKLCAGQMTRIYAHQLGLRHIWTRILSVYGPYDHEQSMIMSTINSLLRGEVPKFTKGEQIWDFLYSQDAARALHLLGEKGCDGKTYVLGSGEGRPIKDYILDIRNAIDPRAKLAIGALPYAHQQVMYLQADTTQLEKDVGWRSLTSFSEGVHQILRSRFR